VRRGILCSVKGAATIIEDQKEFPQNMMSSVFGGKQAGNQSADRIFHLLLKIDRSLFVRCDNARVELPAKDELDRRFVRKYNNSE
jgi:hypothetical protein